MSKPKKMPVIRLMKFTFACKDLTEAGKVMAFLSKLKPVSLEKTSDGYKYVKDGDMEDSVHLESSQDVFDEIPRPSLPAPRHGTVQCEVCENVSVKPGEACGSCGTIAPQKP